MVKIFNLRILNKSEEKIIRDTLEDINTDVRIRREAISEEPENYALHFRRSLLRAKSILGIFA